jgi:hydrogenase nickel incorporation protein HypA/HybF
MHELALARAVVRTAVGHAGGRPVVAVNLRVGALRQVVPGSLEFYFSVAARDTLCEEARLDTDSVAALLRCVACGARWDPAPPPAASWAAIVPAFRCPECSAPGAEVVRGDEFEIESIEVVTEDEECTAPR